MPFPTDGGPAVLVENLVNVRIAAHRLGVHVNSIYSWSQHRNATGFPRQVVGQFYDYAEIYEWFRDWAKDHPTYYEGLGLKMQKGKK